MGPSSREAAAAEAAESGTGSEPGAGASATLRHRGRLVLQNGHGNTGRWWKQLVELLVQPRWVEDR